MPLFTNGKYQAQPAREAASSDDGSGGVTLGPVQTGSVVQALRYDGLGRRIVQEIKNSADLDATYHFYYDGQSVVEMRNGSDLVLQQYLWTNSIDGYIDELAQVAINGNPFDDPSFDPDDPDHDPRLYFALHDANYNVRALVDEV